MIAPALVLFFVSLSFAQQPYNDVDPFLGNYTLGGRADLVLYNSRPDNGYEIGHDFFSNDSALHPEMTSQSNDRIISTDGISGNFLMSSVSDQARDEALCGTMESVGDSSIIVKLYVGQLINGAWSVVPMAVDSIKKKASSVSQRMEIRMTSGYFDGGAGKDFAIAYNLPDSDQMITIRVFKLDSTTNRPDEITSIRDDTLPAGLGVQAFFDIAAGDFDGDGLDEIVFVKNRAVTSISGSNCVVPLSFHAYDFDWTDKKLVAKGLQNASWSVPASLTTQAPLIQLVVGAGDFNGNGKDEGVCGFAINYIPLVQNLVVHYVQPFVLSTDLMTFGFNGSNLAMVEQANIAATQGSLLSVTSMSLASGDLDKDGKDELVVAGINDFAVYKLSSSLSLTREAGFWCYSKFGYMSHHRFAIADIDGDSTFADSSSSKWYPEIVTSEFTVDPQGSQSSGGTNNYHHIKVYKVTDPVTFNLSLVSDLVENYIGALPPTSMADGGILPAYLHGNAIRLGKPKRLSVTSLVEPVVILNAPPLHLDVIGDSCYDICKSYPVGVSTNFFSQYVKSTTSEAELTTNVHGDWGVSATLSAGASFLGIGVKASFSAKYGEGFSKTRRTDSTMTVTISQSTTWDDRIFATVTDYDLLEYPVYASGVWKGDILAAISHPKEPMWFPSNDRQHGNQIILNHEPGNLLSYQNYTAPENNPEMGQLIAKGPWLSIDQTYSSSNTWGLNWQTLYQQSADTTQDYGFTVGASVEGWGVKLETEGKYNRGEINTHSTKVSQNINMTAQFGAISPLYSSANYSVLPYAYWSHNGPLVLDYMVDLPTTGVGGSFWKANYSQKPDLAFNCYYRYLKQKGFTLPATMGDWTKEIAISPKNPRQGDTVTVMAEIHNYSLLATTSPVKVRFYLGSSETGGRVVRSLNGDTVFRTSSPVAARADQTLQFTWRVPAGLSTSDSMLYAVIDPDDSIDELKKDSVSE